MSEAQALTTPAPIDFGEALAVDAPQPSVDEMAARLSATFEEAPEEPSVLDAVEVEAEQPEQDAEAVEAAGEPEQASDDLSEEMETAKADIAFFEGRVAYHEAREQEWHSHAASVLAENDRLTEQVEAYEAGLRALGYELDPAAQKLRDAEAEIARLKAPAPTAKAALEKDRQTAHEAAQRKAQETRFAQARKAEAADVKKAYPQLTSPTRWESFLTAYVAAVSSKPIASRETLASFASDFMGKAQQAAVVAQKQANKTAPRAVHVKQPGAPRSVNSGMPTVEDMAAGLRAAGFAGY